MEELIIELATLITAIGVLAKYLIKFIKETMKQSVKEIKDRLDTMDYNGCKSYLTDFLTDVENGVSKSPVQIERASEVYDHYVKNLNGNSYITTKWGKLMK